MKYRAYAMLVPTIEIFERWRARLLAEDFLEEARLLQDALDPLREAAREIAEGGEDAVDPVLVVKMLVRLNNAVARLDPDLMEEIQRDLGAMGGSGPDFLHKSRHVGEAKREFALCADAAHSLTDDRCVLIGRARRARRFGPA